MPEITGIAMAIVVSVLQEFVVSEKSVDMKFNAHDAFRE
jgi:hypothetical protein